MSNTSVSLLDLDNNPLKSLTKATNSSSGKGCFQVSLNKEADWQIYIEDGELLYATNTLQTAKNLQICLQSLGLDAAEALHYVKAQLDKDTTATILMQDQGFQNLLKPSILEKLHWTLSKDAYESMLWIPKGECVFWQISSLPTGLILPSRLNNTTNLDKITHYYLERLKAWQSISSTFNTPHQRLYCFDYHNVLLEAVKAGKITSQLHTTLKRLLRGLSLRHIAMLLKQDELKVALFLKPYIEQGAIVLADPEAPFDKLPKIPVIHSSQGSKQTQSTASQSVQPTKATVVCIDDSTSMLDEMERLLAPEGYGVTKINDPLKASAQLFRIKPDIILMDVTMPGIDGNQLCKVLRESELFRETPIVMVTGNQGILNKAKSKFSGATDYITKPFDRDKLIGIIKQYVPEKMPK